MAKKPRWICLERSCAHIVSSKRTGGALCGCFLWCGREKYLVPDEIELPRPGSDRAPIVVDLFSPDCHVQLTGEGWMQVLHEIRARKAAAARSGHLDWQQKVDDEDVLQVLSNALRRKR